ncbi:MAG: CbtA family protein [Acetobacteraceae bacterium]|nr:CbtA family protein [Acetobacteraceae bacterium]
MVPNLLVRGMLVGLIAGLLVFGFGKVFGEPQVDRAISFEAAMDEEKAKADEANGIHAVPEPELVSRPVQAGWGLFTGVMVYSAAFGGLFALVFAAVYRRAVNMGPRATSALLAATGFVCVYLVPNLKYPANPPSVGEPETIGYRTALYFSMIVLSVGAVVLASALRKQLAVRHGEWTAALAAIGVYLLAVIVAGSILPSVDEVPGSFPAGVLWHFRVASFGMQAVMWATLGLVFGALTERAFTDARVLGPAARP